MTRCFLAVAGMALGATIGLWSGLVIAAAAFAFALAVGKLRVGPNRGHSAALPPAESQGARRAARGLIAEEGS